MNENEIGGQIVDAAIHVHSVLGPGLLESVYEAALMIELNKKGLRVENQVPIKVDYDGNSLGVGFRVDLLVENAVLIELKSVESMTNVFRKTTLTYLKLGGWRLGYLINFNTTRLIDGLTRIVNGVDDLSSSSPRSPRTPRDTSPK
ncbi:MAG: GxxExxY protein [Phycisphaeraceae bacterium]|nr:GxxExxY protein [Phycisphaeraceae bacterium]